MTCCSSCGSSAKPGASIDASSGQIGYIIRCVFFLQRIGSPNHAQETVLHDLHCTLEGRAFCLSNLVSKGRASSGCCGFTNACIASAAPSLLPTHTCQYVGALLLMHCLQTLKQVRGKVGLNPAHDRLYGAVSGRSGTHFHPMVRPS